LQPARSIVGLAFAAAAASAKQAFPEVFMKARVLSACLVAAIALGPATPLSATPRRDAVEAGNDRRSDAEAQVEFGIKVAQKKLWREASYRFQKATEIDPTYAAAWNNLGIAYEESGDFEAANRAYTKAVELDPDNVLIRQNYDLFKELYDRINRRKAR
jgi:Flp pilus assembly protein TadD